MYFQHICPRLSPPAKTGDYETDRIIHGDTVPKKLKRLKPQAASQAACERRSEVTAEFPFSMYRRDSTARFDLSTLKAGS